MKVLFNGIYYLLVTGIIIVAVLLVATMVPFGGLKLKIVKSGSMEPAIHTGAIVLIKSESQYAVGDVITFGKDTKTQIPTTHRITEVHGGQNVFYTTKGDANDSIDPAMTRIEDVHGKVILTVPYLGFVLDFARKPLGFGLIVGLPATLIIIEEIGKIIAEIKRIRAKNNDQWTNEASQRNRSRSQ